MVNLAQSEPGIAITESNLDTDPWLLNVSNGTIDLKTGTLRTHSRDDLITKLVPVPYKPTATCPAWDAFLNEVMGADQDKIRFLQKSIGYSLTGVTHEQVLFMFHGSGANGKSTFINIVHRLLGDYALTTPTDTLLVKRGGGIPNDVARLKGVRFVSAVETEIGRRLAETLVKQLTGGDRISARFLYGEYFDFDPTFKIFLAVNHKPLISGGDNAIWRRIRLVPFDVTIPPEKRDPNLNRKLESELSGILRWAVEGCLLWQKEGLQPPASVEAATGAYRSEMDVVGDFIDDCCEVVLGAKTSFGDLYGRYGSWSFKNGHEQLDRKEFAQCLDNRGFVAARNKALGRYRIGIRLAVGDGRQTGDTCDGC